MTVIYDEKYQCDVCKLTWSSEQRAKTCEEKHKQERNFCVVGKSVWIDRGGPDSMDGDWYPQYRRGTIVSVKGDKKVWALVEWGTEEREYWSASDLMRINKSAAWAEQVGQACLFAK